MTGLAERESEIAALLGSLTSPDVGADPYPVYARLRPFGPARAPGSPVAFLADYEHCAALLRDQAFGSQSPQWCDRVTPGWREHPPTLAATGAPFFSQALARFPALRVDGQPTRQGTVFRGFSYLPVAVR